jgi:hypothetical protein
VVVDGKGGGAGTLDADLLVQKRLQADQRRRFALEKVLALTQGRQGEHEAEKLAE